MGLGLGLAALQLPTPAANGPGDAVSVMLVIRPVEAIGVEPDVAAFGAAVAEELKLQLSQWPSRQLAVIAAPVGAARASGAPASAGRDSSARYTLDASVRADGPRVRIGVRLARADEGVQVWADAFSIERLPPGAARAETRAGIVIARSVIQQLVRGPEAMRPTTNSAAANALYLKGRALWREENPALLGASAAAFESALGEDPAYAAAHAGLADALNAQAWMAILQPADAYARAKAAALRAIALAPGLSEGHAALGFAQLYFDLDWAAAEQSLRAAVLLDPELAHAHQRYSACLSALGRHDEAVSEALVARELAPLSPGASFELGRSYLFARRFDQAIDECRRTLELEPRFTPALWCLELAETEKARARGERRTRAATRLAAAEGYALSGRPVEALAALESAYAQGAAGLVFVGVNPSYDALRREPRFRALLEGLHWPGLTNIDGEAEAPAPGPEETRASELPIGAASQHAPCPSA